MRKGGCVTGIILLVVVFFGMVLSNPTEQDHIDEIKRCFREEAAQSGLIGNLSSALGVTDVAVDLLRVRYENHILFSTTEYDGEILSYGILGNVRVEKD